MAPQDPTPSPRPQPLPGDSPPSRTRRDSTREPRWGRVVALNALPGLLAGALVTGLLFFLNPDVSATTGNLFRGALGYGAPLATVSALLLTLICRGRWFRSARALPWALTIVLATVAAASWIYASRFSLFLPTGINVRLIKAAFWLTLGALALFYTALLHSVQDRRYGRRSRWGVLLIAVAAVYVMAERRDAFRPPRPSTPLATQIGGQARPHLLFVGVDGATLDAILPLAEQGYLPFFQRVIKGGSYGRLESFKPAVPEALWTTLLTGKQPFRHRIVGSQTYSAEVLSPPSELRLVPAALGFSAWGSLGSSRVPASGTHRQALTLWEILAQLGFAVGAVDWPASVPSQRPVEFVYSERFFAGHYGEAQAIPDELTERGTFFRTAPAEIDPGFLERLGTPLPYSFLESMGNDLWRSSLTAFLLEQKPDLQATFVRLPGLRPVSAEYFGGYLGHRFDGDSGPRARESSRLVEAYYRGLDELIAGLWAQHDAPSVLVVASVYGFDRLTGWERWGYLRTGGRARGSYAQSPDGLLLLMGPGVQENQRLSGARLVDVLPTLTQALSLPIARDLDGRVLTEAFSNSFLASKPLSFVPSYESIGLVDELESSGPTGPSDPTSAEGSLPQAESP